MSAPAPVPGPPSPGLSRPPVPLVLATALGGVEALALVAVGVAELVSVSGERLTMGLSTSLFFLIYGGGLAACSVAVYRLSAWARAPLVLAQLIQLGVAWSFRGGSTTGLAVALAVVALVVLAGVFQRSSLEALGDPPA